MYHKKSTIHVGKYTIQHGSVSWDVLTNNFFRIEGRLTPQGVALGRRSCHGTSLGRNRRWRRSGRAEGHRGLDLGRRNQPTYGPQNGFNGFFCRKPGGGGWDSKVILVVVFCLNTMVPRTWGGKMMVLEWSVCLKGWKLQVQRTVGNFPRLMDGHVFFVQKIAGFTLQLFGHLWVLAKFK